MRTVAIRSLKNRLGELVRAARNGERVTVTCHGVPVADLVPHSPHGLDPDDELLRMVRAGEVRLGNPNDKVHLTPPPPERQMPHKVVMDLLNEVRGER